MNALIAVALRPIAYFLLFVVVVAPIIWALNKVVPNGRLKVCLFKVRSGPDATAKDKWTMALAVVIAYVYLFGMIFWLSAD